MAANNDFFLNFDSNASTWVRQLKTQLQPARDEIVGLQALLTSLERQAAGTGSKVTAALAGQVGGRPPTGGSTPIPGGDRLMANMVAASGELDHILGSLRVMTRGLETLPDKVTNSMRGIQSAIQAQLRQIEGRGSLLLPGQAGFKPEGTAGTVRAGSQEHRIVADFRDALRNLDRTPSLLDRPAIASVTPGAIDKAGVDRIVNAIRAQTRIMAAGLPVRGEVTTVSGARRSRGVAADATLDAAADETQVKLARVEGKLARAMELLGDSTEEAAQEVVRDLEQEASRLRAAQRRAERESTGMTKTQQSERDAAEYAAAQKARPVISADEVARRREVQALINSPGAGDFESRLGRARTTAGGNYSREDLDRMVAAYREVGIIVQSTSKTTKQELADRLKAANVEYRQAYPEGAEALRTTGFNVVKNTKIEDETAQMLGGLDRLERSATELTRAFDILAADARGGGKRPQDAARATAESVSPELGQPRTGNIVVPPSMVKGGEGQRGSGLGLLYTQDEFNAAMVATRADASRAMDNVLRQASQSDFDPYDQRHSAAIQPGNTPEQIRLAQAARNQLRDTRLATQALDAMGQEFFGLQNALADNTARSGNLRTEILAQGKAGQDTSDLEDDYRAVSAEIDNIHRRLQQIPRAMRDVFATPGYKEGLERREGQITDPGLVSAAGFYRGVGTEQTTQKRDELRREIATAEKILAAGKQLVQQLNAEAAKGMEVDTDAWAAAMDGIEDAERALPRLRSELQTIERLFEESADEAGRLADRVGGMGSRQAFEARREAMQARGETFSDWRDVREATGAAVAGTRTNMGSRDQMAPLPNTRFVNGRFVPRDMADGWSKRTQEKLDAATNAHTKTLVDYRRVVNNSESSAEEVAEAQKNLARAANLLANRLARVNSGIAPSFQQLTGFDPAEGSKAERDELRRQMARERAEADRTRKFTSTPEQILERGQQSQDAATKALADSKARLKTVNDRLKVEAERELEARKRLVAGLDADARAAFDAAQDRKDRAVRDETRAFREFNSLASQMPYLRKEMGEQFGDRRGSTGAYLDPFKRTSQGYDAGLGYGQSEAQEELSSRLKNLNRAEGELLRAERDLRTAVGLESSVTDELSAEKRRLQTSITRLKLAVENAKSRVNEYAAKVSGGASGAGGAGGGDAGGTTAVGGADDGDENILRRILAKLNEIHGTLKGGVKITGKANVDSEGHSTNSRTENGKVISVPRPVSQSFPVSELDFVKSEDPAKVAAAIEAQRKRQQGLTDSQKMRAYNQAVSINNNLEAERASTARRSVLEQEKLQAALSMTSGTTREHVAALTRLMATGASEDDINRQRLATYRSLETDLARQGVRTAGRTEAARTIFQGVQPSVDPRQTNAMVGQLAATSRSMDGFRAVDQGLAAGVPGGGLFGEQSEFTQAMFGNSGFWSRVMNSTGTFIVRNFTAGFVFGMTAALQQVVDQAIQAEATFVRVSAAMEATGKDTANIRSDLQGIAADYGLQLNDVYSTAAGLTGLFDNAEDLAAGTRIVGQLQAISGGALNAAEATGVLAATLSSFEARAGDDMGTGKFLEGGVEGAQKVADVLTSIQSNLGVNVEIAAEGVSRMAGLARQMQLSFEETAVFTGQIAKQTNQTGAGAGEQFSRILAAMQTGRGRNAVMEAFGEQSQVGAALITGDYGAAIEGMIAGWDDLTASQQRNVGTAVAGQRQMAAFNALMGDSTDTLNALRKAEDSHGDATDRMDKIMETLNNRLAQFGTQVQSLASNLIQSGILNFFGALLIVTNETLDAINGVLNAFNTFADNTQFLGWLRDAIGLLIGAGIALKLVQASIRGIQGAVRDAQAGAGMMGRLGQEQALRPGETPPRTYMSGQSRSAWGAAGVMTIAPDGTATRSEQRRTGGQISRAIGITLDRTAGVMVEGAGRGFERGLNAVGQRLAPLGTQVDSTRTRFARLTRTLGANVGMAGAYGRYGISQIGRGGLATAGMASIAGTIREGAEGLRDVASEQRAVLRDQQRYQRLRGLPTDQDRFRQQLLASGLSESAVGQRTSAPDASLERSARRLDRLSRVVDGVGSAADRTARGFGRMANSGIAMDASLGLLVVGFGALMQSMDRVNQIARENEKAFDKQYGAGRGLTDEEEAAAAYVGPASDYRRQNVESVLEAGNVDGMMNFLGETIRQRNLGALAEAITFGALGTQDVQDVYREQLGITERGDRGLQAYGTNQADSLMADAWSDLNSLEGRGGTTGDDYRELSEQYAERLRSEAHAILNNEELSEAEVQSALAQLERVGNVVSEELGALATIADGARSAVALSMAQITALDELTSASQAITNLGAGDRAGLEAQINALREEVGGAELGGRMNRLLDRLTDPGSDSIDIAIANKQVAKEKIDQLYNRWRTKIDEGNDEEAAAARQAMLSAIGQYGAATDQIVQSILDQGQLLADQASDMGNHAEALRITEGAMRRAQRQFQDSAREDRGFVEDLPQLDVSQFTGRDENGQFETLREWKTRQYARILENEQRQFTEAALDAMQDDPRAGVPIPDDISIPQARRINTLLEQGSLQDWNTGGGETTSNDLSQINDVLGPRNRYSYRPETGSFDSPLISPMQRFAIPNRADTKAEKEAAAKHKAKMTAMFATFVQAQILQATMALQLEIARATDEGTRAALQLELDNMIAKGTKQLNRGKGAFGISDDLANMWGPATIDTQQLLDVQLAQANSYNAYQSSLESEADQAEADAEQRRADAAQRRADQAALTQARLGVSAAWADARGDAVAAARVQVQVARAAMAAAQAELAAATTQSETAQARIAILNAQAQLIGANAAVSQAQADLVQSQFDVSIALAEAAGNTVLTAQRQLAAARAALRAAMKRSGGKATAEVNAARAEAIRAEASVRDARLQDELDTINFNLEMGRITQSSAIAAMQEILRTHDLTKQQRRDLLLQIKGMKEEMAESQWNFGDIDLPKPYQMRRYIEQRKRDFRNQMDGAAARTVTQEAGSNGLGLASGGSSGGGNVSNVSNTEISIQIDGADVAKVRKIIREEVGRAGRTMTTQSRRR